MKVEDLNMKLVRAAERIQLIQKVGNNWFFCNTPNIHTKSCIWNPEVTNVPCMDMELVETIQTKHPWGHPSLFKPSKYEVLEGIPEELLERVTAFYIDVPSVDIDYDNGVHIVDVKLYATSNVYRNPDYEL